MYMSYTLLHAFKLLSRKEENDPLHLFWNRRGLFHSKDLVVNKSKDEHDVTLFEISYHSIFDGMGYMTWHYIDL